MKDLKKAALAGFGVQVALAVVGLILYLLPSQLGQSGIVALFPFVLGLELGPMLLRPLAGALSPDFAINLAMGAALVSNFMVYTTLFYLWFMLRRKTSKPKPAMA